MSTQRRRVLENSGLIIPADGVYIEGLDGRAYTTANWKGGNSANSVIVASGDVKFRIALGYESKELGSGIPFEDYMTGTTSSATALSDYDGAGNTANMLLAQPSTDYGAGYCSDFTFPDGKTKGFLPSLGQLYLVLKNIGAVNSALTACGGSPMRHQCWSSTFRNIRNDIGLRRIFWLINMTTMEVDNDESQYTYYVHPFGLV